MKTHLTKTSEGKKQQTAAAHRTEQTTPDNGISLVDNRSSAIIQQKQIAQLSGKHPKKAFGTGKGRKDPGHGNVKSKQHAAARARGDAQRERRLQAQRAAAAAKAAKKK
ncbi:MAG: hypothetical protein ACJAUV_001999 [Flavobacteriales bacterium]|jgi:hypothetical protein